jgi:hypothetical protein
LTDRKSPLIVSRDRVIRVFISSTFRDMKEEREILVKRVFPQLRKMCEERQVTWGEVDLRWGITEEQKAEGKVLPICLEEIKRCRPYFIGLLGERYGWIPGEIPQDIIDREPWLKEHLSHSVTELEILHGVLNNPDMAEHAFFYFRDPQYLQNLPEDADPSDFTSEDEASRTKLNNIKERIRKSGFPFRENYANLKALEELVLNDFTKVIDTLYPPNEKIDPLDKDALDHEAFAQSRAQVYIGGEEYFDRLNKHAQSTDPPLVVLGESGSGKSALLANWALKYKKKHSNELVLIHFIGASPYSADWEAMLRRIMGEFKRRFDIQQEIPDKPDELRMTFANWLHMVSAACLRSPSPHVGGDQSEGMSRFSNIILILDALNQIREGAPDLVWLPSVIPENIRLILSTLPGRPLDDLKKRNWPTLTVKPLTREERKIFIEKYLSQYTKSLSDPRVAKIVAAKPSENPLYLKVLLEELRLFGEYEKLDERIDHYLEAQNPYELYAKVLARWEADYEEDNDLVGNSMSLIWASRRGLSESELLDMLGKDDKPLPRAQWSPLFLAARESLIDRAGLLYFSHDFLREAVRNTYILTDKQQSIVHLRLADYFEKQYPNRRKVEELPWQLTSARSWDRLYELLSELEFFKLCWAMSEYDILIYWAELSSHDYKMVDAYQSLIRKPNEKKDIESICYIADLLGKTGYSSEAFTLWSYMLKKQIEFGAVIETASALNMAIILNTWGRHDDAVLLFQQIEKSCRSKGDRNSLAKCLIGQSVVLEATDRLNEAMALLDQVEIILHETTNKKLLPELLGNKAKILGRKGKIDEALALFSAKEKLCKEIGDKYGLFVSLGNKASMLCSWNRMDEALVFNKEEEEICREFGYRDGLQVSLGNQGAILFAKGHLDEAMTLFKKKENICRETGNKRGLAVASGNQASVLFRKGQNEDALTLYVEEERLFRDLKSDELVATSLINQASIHKEIKNYEKSLMFCNEAEILLRRLGEEKNLRQCLKLHSEVLFLQRKYNEIMPILTEQQELCEKFHDMKGLGECLMLQSVALGIMNNDKDALIKAEKALCIAIENNLPELSISIRKILDNIQSKLKLNHPRLQDDEFQPTPIETLIDEHKLSGIERMAKRKRVILSFTFICLCTFGVALGLWKPWLWLIGGPIALISLLIIIMQILMLFPRANLYLKNYIRKHSTNKNF